MRMRRKTETLATVGLFRSLDAANIDLLDTQCSWRRLSRNQWIVDYQDTSNDVFFIVSGAVRVKLQFLERLPALQYTARLLYFVIGFIETFVFIRSNNTKA